MIEREERIRDVLEQAHADVAICGLPANVLLVAGYWPVVGNSIAICTREGGEGLLVPEDEADLARPVFKGELRTFKAGSLDSLAALCEILREPIRDLAAHLQAGGVVAHDGGEAFEPSTYASMNLFGAGFPALLRQALPKAQLVDISPALNLARARLTGSELACVREACRAAEQGFRWLREKIREGATEREVAESLRASIMQHAPDGTTRSGAFTYCMSGPNASHAHAAYQLTRERPLQRGDFVLVHCNSCVGGFWTDITRTCYLGSAPAEERRMFERVLAASAAAVDAVRPGAVGSEVDAAARSILAEAGFGKQFKHATGHGVGFSAINHNAHPRIHPLSKDVLESGMVFNVEPAIYEDGRMGLRQCSMVSVGDDGGELLTPWQSSLDDLIVA